MKSWFVMGGASRANTVMEQNGGGEHGTKHGGVMGCGLWAHGRVCGLGGPQGGRTRDAQGRRCAIWQYGKNNYDPRGARGSNKRGLRIIATPATPRGAVTSPVGVTGVATKKAATRVPGGTGGSRRVPGVGMRASGGWG